MAAKPSSEFNDLQAVLVSESLPAGLQFQRVLTRLGQHPFDSIAWEKRTASITDMSGKTIFEQHDVEVPSFWSQNATNIVASKYFYGDLEKNKRETSAKQLIDRVSRTITDWGKRSRYFASDDDGETFYAELTSILINQYASFNSPVWFNCGVHRYDTGSGAGRYYWSQQEQMVKMSEDDYSRPQCSACFINSVDDTMDSILSLAKTEGMLFKFGSGTGTNFSTIRSSKEKLSGGGTASGPVSFMKGFDAFAGVIKSGGKTRRAAKMVILDVGHPDIMDFIQSKSKEEKKAWSLIDSGYNGAIDGEAYTSVFFQNANHSVRVTDEFMNAVEQNGTWSTKAVKGGAAMETFQAREVLWKIAESTYICGDPGMQYDTTINNWHTSINTDRIHASNPCSEYMYLNDSACNLASINLLKFKRGDGSFDAELYKHAIEILITAQEIIVDNASYPTPKIAENSYKFRPLGLGYANLGALLMERGVAYDSDEGRAWCGALTAIMTGIANRQSALMAKHVGTFEGYAANKEPYMRVMRQHRKAVDAINHALIPSDLSRESVRAWDDVIDFTERWGSRNGQVTVIAPTGTIAFMMDCDTTGIEPDIALVKYKKLVGGGYMKIVNRTVPNALKHLGYTPEQVRSIIEFIDHNDTIEGAPELKPEHLSVFDCAFKPKNGSRSIHHLGHIRMMAAAQPFISGAISKTVNMPEHSTIEEIMDAYIQGWKAGLKALAIYRDGSKRTQPLNTGKEDGSKKEGAKQAEQWVVFQPQRKKLPDERQALTHKFTISGHEGYITVGLYEDGRPGELFITMSKEGSTISGIMDAFATSVSLNLQYGVPLQVLVDKFTYMRFEPSGFTGNKQIPMVKSIMDYIFRWLAVKFLSPEEAAHVHAMIAQKNEQQTLPTPSEVNPSAAAPMPMVSASAEVAPVASTAQPTQAPVKVGNGLIFTFQNQRDAELCAECGSMMVRNGACYKCMECGSTSGCS
ncbi:vitamin B12-dependent ribonucleotide reductase [Candidatus Uhrbacteria bacterium]|nr:vitamin B12-dependent ribonucleotide reductase [Candidatus Uhrbacteria bacterium]